MRVCRDPYDSLLLPEVHKLFIRLKSIMFSYGLSLNLIGDLGAVSEHPWPWPSVFDVFSSGSTDKKNHVAPYNTLVSLYVI